MTEWPEGVRLAVAGDEQRVFELCAMAHAENGIGRLDQPVVTEFIRKSTHREGSVIAIIDGPERIEAMLGLIPQKLWYAVDEPESYYWTETFLFVHPLHRRSRHAGKLFHFARWWGEQIKQPVVLNLLPGGDFEGKEKLFSRYGKKIGAAFLIGKIGVTGPTNDVLH